MSKKRCYYIPADGYVEGEGYRVSVVIEGEPGHRPTGSHPYTGHPRETRPYFWGHDYETACEIAREQNKLLGLTEDDVTQIIASSMGAQRGRAS